MIIIADIPLSVYREDLRAEHFRFNGGSTIFITP